MPNIKEKQEPLTVTMLRHAFNRLYTAYLLNCLTLNVKIRIADYFNKATGF